MTRSTYGPDLKNSRLSPISPEHIERIGKLIKLLSSDNPSEVAAAGKMLCHTLAAIGLDIHDLKNFAAGMQATAKVEPTPVRPSWWPRPTDNTPPDLDDWRLVQVWLEDRIDLVREKNRGFVINMGTYTKASEGQINYLRGLVDTVLRAMKVGVR